jgi:ADP-ribose pyrophosphatase YjhB (NUDIX family)
VKAFHESGVVGGARVWVRDGDRTLLLRDRHRPDEWALPGGAIEAGETAEAAGAREVLEETGIDCSISDVAFLVDETHVPADGSGDPIGGLVACFVADYEAGRIDIQESEVAEAKWWESLPDETGEVVERAATHRE